MCEINWFDLQRGSFVDGPGIRTVLFFKGCNLRCAWCHNPESQRTEPQQAWYPNRCTHCGACMRICPTRAIGVDFRTDETKCKQCGKCVDVCPAAARRLYGKRSRCEELIPELLADREFFAVSGGGVTFSGGECLLQPDALETLLYACREAGVQTAVDTAGDVPWETVARIEPRTDLFLYDIKCISAQIHKRWTGRTNERILANYRCLYALCPEKLIVRIPVIPDANDWNGEMEKIADFLSAYPPVSVELLPYHRFGVPKAEALSQTCKMFDEPKEEKMEALRRIFREKNLQVQ